MGTPVKIVGTVLQRLCLGTYILLRELAGVDAGGTRLGRSTASKASCFSSVGLRNVLNKLKASTPE